MDYQKIDELAKNGLYSNPQLEAIKYACYMPEFDENLIMDPTIPNNIMLTYVKLAKIHKIDIKKYISNKWHLKGFNDEQLYYLIIYDTKGYDISNITTNMSVKEIKETINNKINEDRINKLANTNPQIAYLKNMGVNIKIINFLSKQMDIGYDISMFLKPNIKEFSYGQIKYLFSVYSTGKSIKDIFDPNLTVEQMHEIVLNSKETVEFLQEITKIHDEKTK